MKYLFVRLDEEGAQVKLSEDLDEFKTFCHYASLSDWAHHKKIILDCLDRDTVYTFTANDTWYYVLAHNVWEICDLSKLKLTVES